MGCSINRWVIFSIFAVAWMASNHSRGQENEKTSQSANSQASEDELNRKLAEAKAQRDRELAQAGQAEKDQKRLDKKKQEIFVKFAEISAALRDQYQSTRPPTEASTAEKQSPTVSARRASDASKAATRASSDVGDGKNEARQKLAELSSKLAAEQARHERKLAELQDKLTKARSSGKQKQIDKAQSAINKENEQHASRKRVLEFEQARLQSEAAQSTSR